MNRNTETIILFAIGCFASFSIGVKCTQIVEPEEISIENKQQYSEAINNIQDMKEWMKQDIENMKIDFFLGEYYVEYLDSTEDALIDFAVENGITN